MNELVTVPGTASLFGMAMLLKGQLKGKPLPKSIHLHRCAAGGSFDLEAGTFLGAFGNFIR